MTTTSLKPRTRMNVPLSLIRIKVRRIYWKWKDNFLKRSPPPPNFSCIIVPNLLHLFIVLSTLGIIIPLQANNSQIQQGAKVLRDSSVDSVVQSGGGGGSNRQAINYFLLQNYPRARPLNSHSEQLMWNFRENKLNSLKSDDNLQTLQLIGLDTPHLGDVSSTKRIITHLNDLNRQKLSNLHNFNQLANLKHCKDEECSNDSGNLLKNYNFKQKIPTGLQPTFKSSNSRVSENFERNFKVSNLQKLMNLFPPCNLPECVKSAERTDNRPKFKRSISKDESSSGKGIGFGPIRVFKYVTEDQILNSISSEVVEDAEKREKMEKKNLNKNKNKHALKFRKSSKKKNSEKGSAKVVVDLVDVNDEADLVLRSQGVTDRSLIPNSYFGSQPESQKNNNYYQSTNQIQPQPSKTTTTTTTAFNSSSTSASSSVPSFKTNPNNFNHLKNISNATQNFNEPFKGLEGHKNSYDDHQQTGLTFKPYNSYPEGPQMTKENISQVSSSQSQSSALELALNMSLSDRARRSPFRNSQFPPMLQKQQQQQFMQQQKQNPNRFAQIIPANRAALYNRNGQQMRQQQQMQNTKQFQNPNRGMGMGSNQNQNGPKLTLKPPENIIPSGSNNFFNFRNSPALGPPQRLPYVNDLNAIPEPTWNHPMYRKYSQAAKRVQNQVSGYVIGNLQSSQTKGNNGRLKDHRTEFSKIPPIPLPRPPRPRPPNRNGINNNDKERRVRSRNKGGPPPRPPPPGGGSSGGLYSYPKSAQSIQDILDHFQNDNNEILDDMTKSSHNPASGRRPSGNGVSGSRTGNSNPRGGEGNSDLSSELKDVRFSLMRDIREFSKRPMTLSEVDDDGPSSSNKPFYSDNDRFEKNSNRPHHRDDPHSPSYNHEEGFDEIFNPKSKPVRDMIKTSSRFRQDRESEREREDTTSSKEFQHSKKRDRPFRDRDSHLRDRDEISSGGGSSKSDYYNNNKQRSKYDQESRERYPSSSDGRIRDSSDGRIRDEGRVIDPSEERIRDIDRYKNDRPSRHHPSTSGSSSERHRDERNRISHHHHRNDNRLTSKEERDRDLRRIAERERDLYFNSERLKSRPRSKFTQSSRGNLEDSFDSFERRHPSQYYSQREKEILKAREHPKSIRDKIRESSSTEFNSNSNSKNNQQLQQQQYRSPLDDSKPIVLKRPYESYQIPPELELIPKRSQDINNNNNEFYNNYASATEKSIYGYPNPPILRPVFNPMHNPYHNINNPHFTTSNVGQYPSQNNPNQNQLPAGLGVAVGHVASHEDGDILEIHTGLNPHLHQAQQHYPVQNLNLNPTPTHHQQASQINDEKSLQKAYMELLHHKMQVESALLHPPPLSPHISSSAPVSKPKKAPMRMKIHIYPNNDAVGTGVNSLGAGGGSDTSNPYGNINLNNYVSHPSLGGYSNPTSIVSAPPARQQHFHQKIGGSLRSPHLHSGPVPPSSIGYGSNINQISSGVGGGLKSQMATSVDKNKNLVLHLHVHRRNDAGALELIEAEASEHQNFQSSTTVKPLTYKDIFEEHQQQQQQHENHHQIYQDEHTEGDVEADKSVSMEVPVHDDKIDDILNTLLQFRDRGSDRKKRNHLHSSTSPPLTTTTSSNATNSTTS